MKSRLKKISKVIAGLGVMTFIGMSTGLGTNAYATVDNPYISDNAISDDSSDRTITLWKYEIRSTGELGKPGDGEQLDPNKAPDLDGKKLMGDVEFEIVRVLPRKDESGNYYVLDDTTKQKEGKHYDIDPDFKAIKQKTGDSKSVTDFGKTTFNVGKGKAGDGIYLIREVPNESGDYTYTDEEGNTKKIASPMQAFFAYLPQTKRDDTSKLIYDVHVYPKNIVNDTSADKTIDGQKGTSIKAGQPFQWEATVKLPTGLYSHITEDMTITNRYDKDGKPLDDLPVKAPFDLYADYFYIEDELNQALHLDDVEVEVFDGTNWVKLTLSNDYRVYKNDELVESSPITSPSGELTKIRIELTELGMEKVEGKYTDIRAIFHTHTDVDFNGVIENTFKTGYLIPGQKPVDTPSENNPEYFNGGFEIEKTEEDKGKVLAGAEFHIATSDKNAREKNFLASDGKSYTLNNDGTATPELPKDVKFLKATTDENGKAKFDGLALDWFTDKNGDTIQNKDEPTWEHAEIQRKYWLIETKAPEGFELLKDPIEVVVKLDPKEVTIHVENKTKTKLPFTGGEGTMLIIIIAVAAITIGTVTIMIDKKRRQA
ncbi:SpaH/EbpB family LPXTG-anchored major pilin [Enterococcus hulanensis]|uniref:SpaH/EbpB family LPXTG-anchored major pilin n=1 Tax=Enterococcus hulanensis TaxID=2559929 RepID=UPI0010F97492|nr:SpaH/EbpB family LPXTG-anchored major pilin [Enterococcus hulanensis]